MTVPTRVYLCPGFFGFSKIGSYEYFEHITRALTERFEQRGRTVEIHVSDAHPTASIRRRAARLAHRIGTTAGDDEGPIHILGHSTGGLDARLVASPSVKLLESKLDGQPWMDRLRSVTTMNAPHFGTPLAAFFTTVSGQRLLYAVSALTVAVLKLGAPPLAAASALVAAFGRVGTGALEVELIERTTNSVIRLLDDASSRELRAFLRQLRDDQGAMVQLTPESMDLFVAGVADRPGVRYQSVASYAPGVVKGIGQVLRSPWSIVSAAIFTMLSSMTARHDPRYPCTAMDGSGPKRLRALVGEVPAVTANDGVVPLFSQIWGDLIWVGKADHLDVVGHFSEQSGAFSRLRGKKPRHVDWLASGSGFNAVRFEAMIDRVFDGMLVGEENLDS